MVVQGGYHRDTSRQLRPLQELEAHMLAQQVRSVLLPVLFLLGFLGKKVSRGQQEQHLQEL